MKKIVTFLFFLTLSLLSACGTQETLDKTEVFNQASDAVETLDSYTVDMVLNSNVMDMQTTMEGTGDITHNPDAMYLTMSMGLPGMSMDFETYVDEDEAFMSMFGEWLTIPTEELGLDNFDQLNKEEMDKLSRFSDEFEMTEEDNMYVLILTGEGDEYSELVEPFVQSSMGDFPGADPTLQEDVQNISVNSLDLEVRIDKETMIVMSQTVNADLEIDGEPMTMDGQFDISNINAVEPIEIPDEVRENAVEDFMGDSFGMEEPMSLEEIQESVEYSIPQVTGLPEEYNLIDSWYDDNIGMVMLNYEKDMENGFSLSIYPSKEDYGEMPMEEPSETVTINGSEGTLSDMDGFIILTWEQDGLFLELVGGGPELTRDDFIEFAESVQ